LEELKELSQATEVSDHIKPRLLLKLSGLSLQQRSQIIASCNNQFNFSRERTSQALSQYPRVPKPAAADGVFRQEELEGRLPAKEPQVLRHLGRRR
jgi:hypothetical protein